MYLKYRMKRYRSLFFRLLSVFVFLALLAVVLPLAVENAKASQDEWEWQGPLSEGKHIYGIWGNSENDIFATGQAGLILHFDGIEWTKMSSGTSADLWDVWGTSASDVYAVGLNAAILHYNGENWTTVDTGLPQSPEYNLFCIWGSSSTDIYVGAPGGKVIHYDGSDWTVVDWSAGGIILDVWGTGQDDVFVTSTLGEIVHYNGENWTEFDTPLTPGANQDLWGIWGSSSSDVFAVGRNSVVLHYNGDNWTQMDTGSIVSYIILHSVWGSSPDNVFAVGTYGTIIHYNGTSWTPMFSTYNDYLYAVWGSSGTDIYAVGYYGTIVHCNGTGWLPVKEGAANMLLGIWGSSTDNIITVGQGNTVLRYTGSNWSAVDTGTANSQLNAVWGSSENDTFIVGLDGLILHWDGVDWTQMTSGTSDHLYTVWGTAPDDVHAIGYEKTMLHYDGSTWSNVGPGFGLGVLHGIWGSAADNVWAAGAAGRIYHYNGSEWTQVYTGLGGNYNEVWGSSADNIFFVGDQGKIVHYDGENWTDMTGNTSDHLRCVWGSSPNDVYTAGESGVFEGNIYHFDGTGWTQVDTGLGELGSNHYGGIWGTASDNMFVVGSSGSILHYTGPAIEPNISISPTNHDFGDVLAGESSTPLEIVISNPGTAVLNISGINLSDTANFSTDLSGGSNPTGNSTPIIPIGEYRTLTVTFSPLTTGTFSANLTVQSDDPDSPVVVVPLSGISTVPEPATLSLTATPLNITADGITASVLTANITDQFGNPVPDGTDVVFSTNHGILGSSSITKQTADGLAAADLTSESANETVVATVTATAENISDVIAVFFVPEGGVIVTESQTATIVDSGNISDTSSGVDVGVDATGGRNVTIARYEDNPGDSLSGGFVSLGKYIDVHVDNTTGINEIEIRSYYTLTDIEGLDEDSLILTSCNGTDWNPCSDSGVTYPAGGPAYRGYVWARIRSDTTPDIAGMYGTPFVGVGNLSLPGDANYDGDINVLDITLVAEMILLMEPVDVAGDANGDGSVNVLDITKIARKILGLD